MKVVVQGNLVINVTDIAEASGPADIGSAPDGLSSAEEALFASLIFLIRRHHERTGSAPTIKALNAIVAVFEQLRERGSVPENGPRDTVFLAKLLAIVEKLAERTGERFLAEMVETVRHMLVEDYISDDSEQIDPDEAILKSRKPGGNNGTPGNGSPQ